MSLTSAEGINLRALAYCVLWSNLWWVKDNLQKCHLMSSCFGIFQYKTSKEGSTVGVAVSHASLLAQCQSLTQACGYSEGKGWSGSPAPPRAHAARPVGGEGHRMLWPWGLGTSDLRCPPSAPRPRGEGGGHSCGLWRGAAPCVSRRAVSLFSVLTRSCVICFHIYQDY